MEINNLINQLMRRIYDEYCADEKQSNMVDCSFLHEEMLSLFIETLDYKDADIEKSYIKLSRTFFIKGVPFSQYRDFFSMFTNKLVNHASSVENSSDVIHRIHHIYNIVINAVSQGYLQEILLLDLNMLANNLDESVSQPFVAAHLRWMKLIIIDIQYGDDEHSVELNSEHCEFGQWLNTGEIDDYFTKIEIEQIHGIHDQIHRLGESIYLALKEAKFGNVLTDYLMIARLSLYLTSRLNQKITQKRLIIKSQTDPLTQLKNRETMMPILEKLFEVHELSRHTFSIALLDIDFFKKVNDTYGHKAGDIVLIEIANVLRTTLRSGDLIFRYGGEEFLIIFPHTQKEKVLLVVEKLRIEIENHLFDIGFDKPLQITASMGISTYSGTEVSLASELIEEADKFLYKAKHKGRNRVEG
jgi:diguanylate cyclase (GGDEF)-like protein